MTTPPRRPDPASRAPRRSSRPAPRSATFLERNRNRLIVALGLGGILILGGMAFLGASTPAYACTDVFDPTPGPTWVAPATLEPGAPGSSGTPGPARATEPPTGFVQPDMGHLHVDNGDRVRYQTCPPASGKHYNAPGGPIKSRVYGPDEPTLPQGWIHNLEHGGIVLLYKCPGPACDEAGQAALTALFAKWPKSPICQTPPGNSTPVITRFDNMASPYAAIVWDVVLPMQTLDETALFKFYARQGERFNPEPQCAAPTPTPGPTPTAGPTGTAAPSATTAPSSTPAVSPAASGSAAPAASGAPSPS